MGTPYEYTATNDKGEQVGWDGSQWVPIAPAPQTVLTPPPVPRPATPGLDPGTSQFAHNPSGRTRVHSLGPHKGQAVTAQESQRQDMVGKALANPFNMADKVTGTGIGTAAHGAVQMGKGNLLEGGTEALAGVGDTLAPMVGVGALTNPVGTAVGMGLSTVTSTGAQAGVKAMGGSEKAQNFAAEAGGWIPAAVGGMTNKFEKLPEKLGAKMDQRTVGKASEEITKGTTYQKANFTQQLDRTIQRGHLPEIERKFQPRTVKDAATAMYKYMDDFEESVVKDAIRRHPDGRISGDDVAKSVSELATDEVQKFAPEELSTLGKEISRYAGKDMSLVEAFEHLKRLNAATMRLRRGSPQDAASAERINGLLRAREAAAGAVRQALYGRLETLGEQGIGEWQKDYGAMSTLAKTMYQNVARAEKAGKGPGLGDEYLKGHNPWIILSAIGLGGYAGEPGLGAMGAMGIPFMKWVADRRATPNARVGRAFKRLGKTGLVPPDQKIAPPPAGLLGSAPTQMGSSTTPLGTPSQPPEAAPSSRAERMGLLLGPAPERTPRDAGGRIPLGSQKEPIIDAGPMAQDAAKGKPGRIPKGKEGGGQMTKSYTTSSTFKRPPVLTWDPQARKSMVNASGESAASAEAISRVNTERSAGIKRVKIDTRSGKEIPLIGVDAVDAKAGPYDRIIKRYPDGREEVQDQGTKARPTKKK